jgi:hypothetical protein
LGIGCTDEPLYGAITVLKYLVASLVLVVTTVAANAADFTVERVKGTKVSVVTLTGDIVEGDFKKFAAIANKLPNRSAFVVLNSDGGRMIDGLDIGLAIRAKHFGTVAGKVCASACGLIWLAGTPRAVFEFSNVGFHSAYKVEDKAVSGGANAVVGAYLAKLGFSYRTIYYLTNTAPQEMEWLNAAKAKDYNITFNFLEGGKK